MNISQWPKVDVRWYLGVRCEKCDVPILFGVDRTEGTDEPQPTWTGKLVLTCTLDGCRHQGDYTTATISRFQKQSVTPNPAGRKK